MQNKNQQVVFKKNTLCHLALEGEGGTKCRVRGKVHKANLICTPSSALQTSSPSRGKWIHAFTKIVMLNSFQHLHLNQPSYKAEEILNQVQDDNRKGFTLIELLVVVLIIGILAAVALPQYQKAVWKSRYTQAEIMAVSLAKAMEIYFLANGQYTKSIEDLDIDLPASSITNTECNSTACVYYVNWGQCYLKTTGEAGCTLYKDSKKFLQYTSFLAHSSQEWVGENYCFARQEALGHAPTPSDINYQICQNKTGRTEPNPSWTDDIGFLY